MQQTTVCEFFMYYELPCIIKFLTILVNFSYVEHKYWTQIVLTLYILLTSL